jgi:hypothetical protein
MADMDTSMDYDMVDTEYDIITYILPVGFAVAP